MAHPDPDWRHPRPGAGLLEADGVAELRRVLAASFDDPRDAAGRAGMTLTTAEADGVELLVLTPPPHAVRGAVVMVHGGGLVAGSPRFRLAELAARMRTLSSALVLPSYRLAPEHPYPAALDDLEAAWRWITASAPDDSRAAWAGRPVVLVGGSAGGMLAAALALRLRDRGQRRPDALALLQPMLDDRLELPSTFEVVGGGRWDRASNERAWRLYAGGLPRTSDLAPARAADYAGLPPTFVEVGQADALRDEALAFAGRASADGVPVELHLWAGAEHGFEAEPGRTTEAAWNARLAFLDAALTVSRD